MVSGLTLILAVDVSNGIIAVVGAEDHILKSGFLAGIKWLKHFRRVPSRRKHTYLRAFPRRYAKVLNYLKVSRVIINNINELNELILTLRPELVVVDDNIFNKVSYESKIKESGVKARHLRTLTLLADNLANYFRVVLKERPKKFNDELRKFMK